MPIDLCESFIKIKKMKLRNALLLPLVIRLGLSASAQNYEVQTTFSKIHPAILP